MDWSFAFVVQPYGDRWRTHRRLFHREFQGKNAKRFEPHQTKSTHTLLKRLLESPAAWEGHLRQYVKISFLSSPR